MELSAEDSLRVQVLLHNQLQSVRIDEHSMTLYALTTGGEANIPLSPNCQNDEYLKILKAILSEHVLGSTGAYPVYLKRWTRMQQAPHNSLEDLLKLGEVEAVMAVANSPNMSINVAKLTWWCSQNMNFQAEIAYHLLQHRCVVDDDLGQEVASFLYEYLPFLQEVEKILLYLSVILQAGLLNEAQLQKLADRSKNKSLYQVGFIVAMPDNLPLQSTENSVIHQFNFIENNKISHLVQKTLSVKGQAFICSVGKALSKVSNEEMIYPLLEALGKWFESALLVEKQRNLEAFAAKVEELLNAPQTYPELNIFLQKNSNHQEIIRAMLILAGVSESVVFKQILHTGAVGSQLRKRISPVTDLIFQALEKLS